MRYFSMQYRRHLVFCFYRMFIENIYFGDVGDKRPCNLISQKYQDNEEIISLNSALFKMHHRFIGSFQHIYTFWLFFYQVALELLLKFQTKYMHDLAYLKIAIYKKSISISFILKCQFLPKKLFIKESCSLTSYRYQVIKVQQCQSKHSVFQGLLSPLLNLFPHSSSKSFLPWLF